MTKKSEGLPINMVIIAAIALGVLVVSFVIFGKGSSLFAKDAFSCESKGGNCVKDNECKYEKSSFQCTKEKEKPVCCMNPSGG